MHFEFDEKQHGGTKQWSPCLNLKSRQRETPNWGVTFKLQTEVRGL